MTSRLELVGKLFKPRLVKVAGAGVILLGLWDQLSNQFGLPKLGDLIGFGAIPIWVYADLILFLLVMAVFELQLETMRAPRVLKEPPQAQLGRPVPEAKPQPVAEPDIQLPDVVSRIVSILENPTRELAAQELADKVVHRGMTVWARSGDQALALMQVHDLRRARFDLEKGNLVVPTGQLPIRYKDVRFVRTEVDRVWPVS